MSRHCWPELAQAILDLTDIMVTVASVYSSEYADIPGATTQMNIRMEMAPDGSLGSVFEPWKTLPEPNDFQPYAASLEASIADMRPAESITLETTAELSEELAKVAPNIAARMSAIEVSISGWQGKTVDEFRKNYVNKFPYMEFAHVNIAQVLILAIDVLSKTYAGARESVVDIVVATGKTMAALECYGSEVEETKTKSIIKASLEALKLISGPIGAIAGALNDANNALDSIEKTIDLHTGARTKNIVLSGSTMDAVWASMLQQLDDLAGDIEAVEADVRNAMDIVLNALDDRVVIQKNSYPLHTLLRPSLPNYGEKENITDTVQPPDEGYAPPEYEFEGKL